jgi:hypothetical protein
MDSRKMLEGHLHTLNALLAGGIRRGVAEPRFAEEDELQVSLRDQWESQRNVLRRVLSEPGDPFERLMEWRDRTSDFLDKYPEREGWTDREGQSWNAQQALLAIDKLLEQVEAWEMDEDEFEDEEYEEQDG